MTAHGAVTKGSGCSPYGAVTKAREAQGSGLFCVDSTATNVREAQASGLALYETRIEREKRGLK